MTIRKSRLRHSLSRIAAGRFLVVTGSHPLPVRPPDQPVIYKSLRRGPFCGTILILSAFRRRGPERGSFPSLPNEHRVLVTAWFRAGNGWARIECPQLDE